MTNTTLAIVAEVFTCSRGSSSARTAAGQNHSPAERRAEAPRRGRAAGRELTAKYGFHETADWRLKTNAALFAHAARAISAFCIAVRLRYAFYPLVRAGRIIVRGMRG
jgi:hypothetical protein